jgi:enoyl-CoA hydratase/carnithine racemase
VRPDDAVVARARELAQTISAYPAQGISAVKRGLRAAHTRRAPGDWFDACTASGAKP